MIAGDALLLVIRNRDSGHPFSAKDLADIMLGRGRKRWAPDASTRLVSVGPENSLMRNFITCVHAGGERRVLRIVTKHNRAISIAADCMVLTPEGFKRANELFEQDLVTIAPWPRKFGYLAPKVLRDPSEPWRVYPTHTSTDKIFAIIDVGFAHVYDFDIEFPFNNYSASEFVVSSG